MSVIPSSICKRVFPDFAISKKFLFSFRVFLCYIRPQNNQGHPAAGLNTLASVRLRTDQLLGYHVHLIRSLVWAVGTERRRSNYRLKLIPGLPPCDASSRNVKACSPSSVVCFTLADIPFFSFPNFYRNPYIVFGFLHLFSQHMRRSQGEKYTVRRGRGAQIAGSSNCT